MNDKILKLNIYQPFAHYREPKIMQDDYIPTLNIPAPTTIAGMISYVCDYKFEEEFDIGVLCKYQTKDTHFIRGEKGIFLEEYIKEYKKNKMLYDDFKYNFGRSKDNAKGNRIMNYEVLQEIELTIFLKFKNENEFKLVKEVLENPKRYMSLGRKEDFVVKHKDYKYLSEDVTDKVKTINIKDKRDSLKNKYKVYNTYIPVNLNDKNSDDILNNGILCSLPKTYKNINDDKTKREMIFQHYVYVDEDGYYPKEGEYCLFEGNSERYLFKWLVKVGA